ncbi:HAD-IIA family hydrolase [[Clostridium] polysaccharolyticum]|uniref:Acid sugar phosphatase n=1 Tax=[Clostridium] polysaccharolyticum TaxID=29364 RepID=A0A1H9ZDD9_9FIRM|nr:HAD-IIA family hydrolase [[Clostridium] polysaccharolyticum]SES79558.1 HAD-superfamily subfamily IIA hydrolase, TIGR01457 [[Clostridium] polysaccharolyticum]
MKKLTNEMISKKLFLLDIDGTVGFDDVLLDGAMDFFHRVKEKQGKYVFITNNSTKSISDYVDKFIKMGVDVDETSFITSSYATARYLKEKYREGLIFVVGTASFLQELRSFGLNVTEDIEASIEAVVVGFDNELTYEKIRKACELLETREVDYIATNPDLVCPVGFGYIPDCGAICDFIEKATKKTPLYVGKPNPVIIDMCLQATGFSREETVVIGDRLYTDIACGNNASVDTVVVFTGEAKPEDLEETEFGPTYFCDSIADIYQSLCSIGVL